MAAVVLKVSRIGNSRGIRLPAAMLRKCKIGDTVLAEETAHAIILRPAGARQEKLSREETYREMAAAAEDCSEWDCGCTGVARNPGEIERAHCEQTAPLISATDADSARAGS